MLTPYFRARLRIEARVFQYSATSASRTATFPNGPDFFRGIK